MAQRNIKGEWFGELRAIKCVGTFIYAWGGQSVPVAAWLVRCKRGHRETRSLASLRKTGKTSQCKECHAKKRLVKKGSK
jgi:hypothetical protein